MSYYPAPHERRTQAANAIVRWENQFTTPVVRTLVRDAYKTQRSKEKREVYRSWLDAHPEGTYEEGKSLWEQAGELARKALETSYGLEVDVTRSVGDTFNLPLPPAQPAPNQGESWEARRPMTIEEMNDFFEGEKSVYDEEIKQLREDPLPMTPRPTAEEVEYTVNNPSPKTPTDLWNEAYKGIMRREDGW